MGGTVIKFDLIMSHPNATCNVDYGSLDDGFALRTPTPVTNFQNVNNVRHQRDLDHIKKPMSNM